MKILQICSARTLGGGERHLVDLAHALSQDGHDVFVALSTGSPLATELSFLPTRNIFELARNGPWNALTAIRLARFVREHAIEIIHAHPGRDYALAAFVSWWSGKTPYVLTRHVLFPLKSIHKLTLRDVSRIIAVSHAVAAALKKQNLFDPRRIITIHNGIDTQRFSQTPGDRTRPAYLEKVNAPLLVGMVGHLAPIKGQEEFIRAAAIVASRRSEVAFIVAGEDKSRTGEHRAAITNLIGQLGMDGHIHLLGWIDEVTKLLRALDLLVSPSRSEPFGLAIVEAMASGVPVIASASEGSSEIVDDQVTGRLFPIGDVETLARIICDLLADEQERKRLSGNAKVVAQERFSIECMVASTEQVYRQVVNGEW